MAQVPKEYRKAVDITAEEAKAVFEALPAALLANPKTFYPKRVFKNAPSWGKAARLVPALNALLDATKGRAVHQKSFQAHFKRWVETETDMEISETDRDEMVLSIRAPVCQLLNHKNNSRSVPAAFTRCYMVIWQKLADKPSKPLLTERSQVAHSDADSDDIQVVEPQASKSNVVNLEDSDDDLLDKDLLFSSSNPALQTVLENSSARRRRRSKSQEVAVPQDTSVPPALDLGIPNLQSLCDTNPADIDPKTYKDINKSLKQRKGGQKSQTIMKKTDMSNTVSISLVCCSY